MKARVKRNSMKEEVIASESDLPTLAQSIEMKEMMQERAKMPQANPQLSARSGMNPVMTSKGPEANPVTEAKRPQANPQLSAKMGMNPQLSAKMGEMDSVSSKMAAPKKSVKVKSKAKSKDASQGADIYDQRIGGYGKTLGRDSRGIFKESGEQAVRRIRKVKTKKA